MKKRTPDEKQKRKDIIESRKKKTKRFSAYHSKSLKQRTNDFLREQFKKIEIFWYQQVIDYFVTKLLWPCKTCIFKDIWSRQKFIDVANERFEAELDLVNIIEKVRNSHDILNNMLHGQAKTLLKVNEERVIVINSDEDDDDESEEVIYASGCTSDLTI